MDAVKALRDGALFRGRFDAEGYRWHDEQGNRFRDSRGRFERRLMWTDSNHNHITNEALDRILNVMFNGGTQTAAWYVGIFESDTTLDGTETYDVPVFTESTAYAEATRPAYVEATSVAQSTTNSANKAVFTINATKTIYGAALFSINTKGDHTGGANNVLFCGEKFSSSRACLADDVINVTYTVNAADV